MSKERQSNFELLRILSVVMVLVLHLDGGALGIPEPMGDIASLDARDWWRLIVQSIAIIGVNCFTLISGYFGIKAHWRGFMRFAFTCLFYSLGIYLALVVAGLIQWRWSDFADAAMALTHTDLWYVRAYVALYLLSPMLNEAIKTLDRRRYMWALLSIVALNVYAGWLWGGTFNATGFSVMQLVMMYLIGQYLGRYGLFRGNCDKAVVYVSIYVLSTVAFVVQALYCETLRIFAYNNPFVIISSVAFFMWFSTMKFKSSVINVISASAFAVYLLHKNPYIWGGVIKRLSKYMWDNMSLVEFTRATIAFVVVIYLVSFAVDRVRMFIASRLL